MKKPSILYTIVAGLSLTASMAADFDIRDEAEFRKIVATNAKLEKLSGGFRFIEGPVWRTDKSGGFLVFSDIPANELKAWSSAGGVKTFRNPSNNANGDTIDLENQLVSAEHFSSSAARN